MKMKGDVFTALIEIIQWSNY